MRMSELLAKLNSERELAYDLLRVYLGVALFARGVLFVIHGDALLELSDTRDGAMWAIGVMHLVVPAHMVGGFLLTIGLFTRLAALVQVPVLMGAVFFVHWGGGLMTAGQGLELATLTLFALMLFVVFGPGHMSLDTRFFPNQVEGTAPEGEAHAHA